MSKQKTCLKISAEKLSEYLFKGRIKLSHIEFDHDTDTIKFFMEGIGHNIAEGASIPQYEIGAILEQIRTVCQKTQD